MMEETANSNNGHRHRSFVANFDRATVTKAISYDAADCSPIHSEIVRLQPSRQVPNELTGYSPGKY